MAIFHSPATEHPVLVADVVRLEEARGDGRHQGGDAVRVEVQLGAEAATRGCKLREIKLFILSCH